MPKGRLSSPDTSRLVVAKGMSKEDPKSPKHLASGPQAGIFAHAAVRISACVTAEANRVKVNPQPPNQAHPALLASFPAKQCSRVFLTFAILDQLCGDVDTLPACENSSLLSMPPVCAGLACRMLLQDMGLMETLPRILDPSSSVGGGSDAVVLLARPSQSFHRGRRRGPSTGLPLTSSAPGTV